MFRIRCRHTYSWETVLCLLLDVIDDEFLWEIQMKWLALSKEAKTISFSHVIKIYKSKLLCSLQIIFSFNFCSQHMIASSITSIVVCIIDYSTTIIKTVSSVLLHCTQVYQFFLSLSLSCWLMLWVLTSVLLIWLQDFSSHFTLFSCFILLHCTSILLT